MYMYIYIYIYILFSPLLSRQAAARRSRTARGAYQTHERKWWGVEAHANSSNSSNNNSANDN